MLGSGHEAATAMSEYDSGLVGIREVFLSDYVDGDGFGVLGGKAEFGDVAEVLVGLPAMPFGLLFHLPVLDGFSFFLDF